jgi:hypothetical protein
MKSIDLKAIQGFDTTQHKYLSVVKGSDGQEHLEVKKVGFLGRIWMKLGFSSCSMEKVAKYFSTIEFSSSDLPNQETNYQNFRLLSDKFLSS